MIKAVLFDIDGVLIPQSKLFSQRFAEEYGVDQEEVDLFFKGPFKKCIIGEADLKEELKPYLKAWKWDGNTEDFLDYWFSSELEADEDILKVVDKMRMYGVDCHLASNQEKYRAEFLLEDLRFADYFDESFFSCDLKTTKKDKEFFKKVLEILNLEANEVMFFDDDPENVESALASGVDAHVFTDLESFREKVRPLISN